MFVYRQKTGRALSKHKGNQKFDKKYKQELIDPNLGLDYVSPLIHVEPYIQERFQSQQFVKNLLKNCKNNQRQTGRLYKEKVHVKQTVNNAVNNLGIKSLTKNVPLIGSRFKFVPKIKNQVVSRTKTQAASIQYEFTQNSFQNTQSSSKRQRILSQKDTDLKRKMPNRFKTSQSVVSNKISHCQQESYQDQSEKQEGNDNIFLNSAFLRNKQSKRLKIKFQVKQSLINTFNEKALNNDVKTATISSRHNFKPNKVYFNNEVAFVKRNSDCVKMNAQNINEFVSEVIELYGNNYKGKIATEGSSRQSPMKSQQSFLQRQFRNKKESLSSQNNRWSRNSHSINRHCFSQNASQLTTKSFYSVRPKTQQKASKTSRRTIT